MSNRPTILILYDYFFPAYKAGGVTQSLYNLYNALQNKYAINIICSNKDLNNEALIEERKMGQVKYINKLQILKNLFQIDKKNIDYIYLNGIFSPFFFFIPLCYFKIVHSKITIVIAPRGMLQSGALAIRPRKKIYYLGILKSLGMLQNNLWHATDEQECEDIKNQIGPNSKIIIAPNIPKQPIAALQIIKKEHQVVKLVFLSLITEKKNLHLILESLKVSNQEVIFDIYGPIKDYIYWDFCKKLINELPSNIKVTYKGAIEPPFVQQTLQKYHALILPSKGENFGHAIYEALSVGRPIIISHFTPWNNLKEVTAGWNVNLNTVEINDAINELQNLSQTDYIHYCQQANLLAKEYFVKSSNIENYNKLFQTDIIKLHVE